MQVTIWQSHQGIFRQGTGIIVTQGRIFDMLWSNCIFGYAMMKNSTHRGMEFFAAFYETKKGRLSFLT